MLVTGKDGQLGRSLVRQLSSSCRVIAVGRSELDIADRRAVADFVGAAAPDVIVNAAAYTDVDGAERDSRGAFAVNRDGVAGLAHAARACEASLLHISTDFVFNGRGGAPYDETAATDPINAYGASKLAGERALAASGAKHLIVRTSWLFSECPGNFVTRVFALLHERDALSMVEDQIGTPTEAGFLAEVVGHLLRAPDVFGTETRLLHVANGGQASRFEVAAEILAYALAAGAAPRVRHIRPITTSDYPLPAARPPDSRLATKRVRENYAIEPPDWRTALDGVLARILPPGERVRA